MKRLVINRTWWCLVCLVACLSWAVCATASAGIVTYNVTDDTYIDGRYTTDNFGTKTGVKVFLNPHQTGQAVPGEPCHGLYQAPSELAAIAADDLVSVKFWVCNYGSTGLGGRAIELHPLTQGFTETGATWNTYNGTDSWATGGGDYDAGDHVDVYTPDHDTWYVFDITSMLKGANRDNVLDYGMLLKISGEDISPDARIGHNFASSEYSDAALRPYFEVDVVPEPASFLLLAMGLPFVWWFRKKRAA